MNVFEIIAKLRVWGVAGIRDFVTKRICWWRLARKLERIAKLDADATPVRGITLIGDFKTGSSNTKTNRDFAHALKDAGIPFQTFSVDRACTVPESEYADILTPESEFRLHKYTHVIEMFRSPLPRHLVKNRARIAFWEGEHGMFDVWPFLRGDDALIAMSDFNYEYFKRAAPGVPVHKILYPLRRIDVAVPPADEVRRRFGLVPDDFVVFFNFDFGSYKRKNVLATVRAFAQAFRDEPRAKLVFKVKEASTHAAQLAEVRATASALGVADRLVVITEFLPHALLYGLTAACDVYVSLHKGEGFGIGMAEAMLFGKPVVATDWSANTEFCVPGASCPVPYKLVPVQADEYFTAMKEWAEADVDAAAKALRALHDDPACRAKIGAAGKAFIEEHFSNANFKKTVDAFLGSCLTNRNNV